MPSHVLVKLKSLRYKRSDTSPFKSHTAFREWADRAIPLLAFDKGIQASFKRAVATAEVFNEMNGIEYPVRAVNEAIGLLNQATDELELREKAVETSPVGTAGTTPPATLEPPTKVTIRWLIDHLPVPLAVAAGAILVSAFGLGVAFSETQLYALIKTQTTSEGTVGTKKSANPFYSAPSISVQAASAPK
jgi:hypothetical protein